MGARDVRSCYFNQLFLMASQSLKTSRLSLSPLFISEFVEPDVATFLSTLYDVLSGGE